MTSDKQISPAVTEFVKSVASKANQRAFAAYQANAVQKYRKVERRITEEVINEHLSGVQPIACYFVVEASTSVAVLDFDDHDNSLNWNKLVAAARPVVEALEANGMKPFCCRSGGGAGLHIWLLWDAPQSASQVKQFLRRLIESVGFTHGTGGVRSKQIEVFPKNSEVRSGKLGNAVALPFSRKSVPLDSNFEPIELSQFNPPKSDALLSQSVSDIYSPMHEADEAEHAASSDRSEVSLNMEVLPGDDEQARSALKFIDADDYETWIKVGLALKHSLGDAAFSIWDEWSKKSNKYEGTDACREVWDGFLPDSTLTIGTVFYLAKERGWDGPKHAVIREMNARYGIWTHGTATRIIIKKPVSGEVLTVLAKGPFIDRLKPEKFRKVDENGGVSWVSKAQYWLEHEHASHYHEVSFDPTKPAGHNGKRWNMWQGFAVNPKPGDWGLLQHHILENVCKGHEALAAWLLNWMALGVQQPGGVIGTAPVLIGLPGTGKGVLANAYGHLWGVHYVSITKDDHISGRFNQHLEARRFVYVDEAMFGGDRKNAGVIKTMLTEPKIMIERKGVDPVFLDNHMIFMVTSNERSVVPADIGDRRWQVIEVGDTRREDHGYFGAINEQMRSGGYAAMMHDLLTRDISVGPDPRTIIRTAELFDQIMQSQGPEVRYLYQILDAAHLPQPDAPGNGPGVTTIAAMYEEMRQTQPSAQYVQQTLFGRTIGKMFPGLKKVQSGQHIVGRSANGHPSFRRSTRYHFPPLLECRMSFARFVGQEIPWSNTITEWQGAPDTDENKGPF